MDSTNRSTPALEINPILRIRIWLGTLNEEQVKRRALSALLLLQIALMAIQSIPPRFFLVTAVGGEGLVSALASRVTPYASGIGLFQAWAMFAPNPKRENTYVDAEITYRDGRLQNDGQDEQARNAVQEHSMPGRHLHHRPEGPA